MEMEKTPPPIEAGSAGAGRSERDLEVLARVGRKLLGSVQLDQQLGLTLRLASEAVGANRASVMLLDADTGRLEIRCSVGLPPEAILSSSTKVFAALVDADGSVIARASRPTDPEAGTASIRSTAGPWGSST